MELRTSEFHKPPKLLPQEYASFRPDVIECLIMKMQEETTILDPMAGTAPLIPFVEKCCREAIFFDLLPIHFFLNTAKTIDVFNAYQRRKRRNGRFLRDLIISLLRPLGRKAIIVSDEWLHRDVVDDLHDSWQRASIYAPDIAKLLRASLILSVRSFSSFSASSNTTWMKRGGVCLRVNIDSVANEIDHKFDEYYKQAYGQMAPSALPKTSGCTIHLGDACTFNLKKQKYLVLTSPAFANRYDYVQAYYPELYFLHHAASCSDPKILKGQILASNKVSNFLVSDDAVSLIRSRSSSAFRFISSTREVVPKSRVLKENDYYFRYYLRYYYNLFRCLDNLSRYADRGSEFFLVVQTNMHRGELNDIDQFLVEYFCNCGFECRIVQSWNRSHQGRRNISRHHPLVLGKHRESIVWARKMT